MTLPPNRIGKRTRCLLGGSGLLLFVCMFLPAVKVCDKPAYPTEFPLFCVPYEFGLACVIVAITVAMFPEIARWALRAAVASLVVTGASLIKVGLVVIVFAVTMLWVIGGRRVEIERGLAGATIAMGVTFTLCFGLLSLDDPMYGAVLSLLGLLGITVAALKWLFDLDPSPTTAEPVPRATARRR